MLLVLIAVYVVITFILTLLGIEKQTEGFKVFIISLLLTPVIGLIYLYSIKNKSSKIRYYYCHECDYVYPVKMSDCPICAEEGRKTKLVKYKSPYEITNNIQELSIA